MKKLLFYVAEGSKALQYAKLQLSVWGYAVTTELTEAVTHILLPVPTPPDCLPPALPDGVTVFGGNLKAMPCKSADFLQDAYYLAENADITALCAMDIAKEKRSLTDASVLIIGWGRIGKCLAIRMAEAGADVTLAVRRESSLDTLRERGINAVLLSQLKADTYDILFNTAPAPILAEADAKADALLIDLASVRGISGDRVIWARGLPGKMAPALSGSLIAKTALRYALGKE